MKETSMSIRIRMILLVASIFTCTPLLADRWLETYVKEAGPE